MPGFIVKTPLNDAGNRINDTDMVMVFAADAGDARAMAKSLHSGDTNASWDDATVTQQAAAADYEGWRLRCRAAPPGGGPNAFDVTYTGAASDTMDLMGAGAEALLDAAGQTATYTGATQVLECADIADGIGDHFLLVELLPPLATSKDPVAIPGGVVSKVDEGIAAAILSATLAVDAYVLPLVGGQGKQSA